MSTFALALPSGKQRSIHGPAVNVPAEVDTVCNILPRLPSQSELVPLKLTRKLAYKGHYMYDYVTPQKLLDANNPLYANIDVNQEWLEAAVANDADLCECLVEQHNDVDEQPNTDNTVEPIVDSPTDIAMARARARASILKCWAKCSILGPGHRYFVI